MPKMDPVVPKQPKVDHPERLAISLADVERIDPMLRHRTLHGRLDLAKAIKVGTDAVVAFSCDLLLAALACDVIQSEFRREGDSPVKVYILHPGRPWWRLSASTVLTIPGENGKAELNHLIFPSALEIAPLVEPPRRVVSMGD
jgi:hypothetical protein